MKTGIERAEFRQSLWYMSMYIYIGLGVGAFGAVVDNLAAQVGVSPGTIGIWFLPAGGFGYLVGTVISGKLLDRFPAHKLLAISLAASALLCAAIPLVSFLPLLAAINFLKGFIDSLIGTSPNTLLTWMHGKKSEPYINALHFFFGLGAFLGPFFAGVFVRLEGGYRLVYWILAAYALILALRFLAMGRSPAKPAPEAALGASTTKAKIPWALVVVAAIALFFYVSAELCFGNWAGKYSTLMGILDQGGAAFLLSAFWGIFTLGRLISIPASRRWRPETILAACIPLCILACVPPLIFPTSPFTLWASAAAIALFMAPIWPSVFNLASRSIALTATLSSLIFLGDSLGGLVLPSVTGKVFEWMGGAGAMFFLVGGSLALLLIAYIAMLRARPALAKPLTN